MKNQKSYELKDTKFLKDINYPKDLKKLNLMDLRILADELREYLIETISHIDPIRGSGADQDEGGNGGR